MIGELLNELGGNFKVLRKDQDIVSRDGGSQREIRQVVFLQETDASAEVFTQEIVDIGLILDLSA